MLIKEMDQGVNLLLKMIEQDGASSTRKVEMCKQARPDLIVEIEEFYCLYRSLIERYNHLNVELYKSLRPEFQMQNAGTAPQSPVLTPDQKLGSMKTNHVVEYVGSGGASSDLSLKDVSDLSSSSSDSESESFNSSGNAYYSLPMNTDHKVMHKKIMELGTTLASMGENLNMDMEEIENGVLTAEENENYKKMLSMIIRYEEELEVSNLKLQHSEDEVKRLKNELAKSEYFMVLADALQAQLESANRGIKMREADLEAERTRVKELQKQIVDGSHELQGQLKLAQEENIMLKAKLDSDSQQVQDLQERIVQCKNELSERDDEIKELKRVLVNVEETFLFEKTHLESCITSLSGKENLLEARLRDCELQCKIIEDKLLQCQTEKMELQLVHDTHSIGMQAEISQLKVELGDRSGQVEILNKNLDNLKFKYDMLVAEKNGIDAKLNTVIAELSSRDSQIGQMEAHLQRRRMENVELTTEFENVKRLINELRLRVVELEKEVDRQKGELSDRADEKREAIRQLCISLEHYRNYYKELSQAFLQRKRQAVMAS